MSDDNNKKREIEEIDDTNDGYKKQKIDEINGTITDIVVSNLKSKTVTQLKDIASLIGLTFKSSSKKGDIIDSITFTVNKKKELLEKQKIDDNINSFNKGVVEFTIKEGVDASEWSFWKVFRNKFIYKRIMSFMDTHLLPTYDSITSVDKMIKSGQISMLRDKIIRNQHLTFKGGDYEIINQISNLFIRNDESDTLLYRRFFKYYSKYIFHFNNVKIIKGCNDLDGNTGEITDGIENKIILINQLIQNGCLVAVKVLAQDYGFQLNNDNFIKAISMGSKKIAKFILQQSNFKPKLPLNIPIMTMKSFKVLIYLQSKKNMISLDEVTLSKYLKSCLIEIDEMSMSVKQLIPLLQLLLTVYKTNEGVTKSNEETINSILQQIPKIFSTVKELKSVLTDKSNQTNEKKQLIIKILDLIYLIGGFRKSEYYYLYFASSNYGSSKNLGYECINRLNEHLPVEKRTYLNYKLAYQFGNQSILENCYNSHIEIVELSKLGFGKDEDFLFTHCKNKEQQNSFLKFIVGKTENTLSTTNFSKNQIKNEINFTILILINHDNLQLLKYFIGLQNIISLLYLKRLHMVKYVKSVEMLTHLWMNHNLLTKSSVDICEFRTEELLNEFELFYYEKAKERLKLNSNYKPDISIINRVLTVGSTLYRVDIKSGGTIINECNCDTNEKFKMFKKLFLNYQLNPLTRAKEKEHFVHDLNSIAFSKYLNWLFIYYPDYLKTQDKSFLCQDQIAYRYYYQAGRYDQLIGDKILTIPFTNGEDISKLDFILKKYSVICTSDFMNYVSMYLSRILLEASKQGWLKSFEHIHQHHNWVFKVAPKQSTSVLNGAFKPIELKKLVFNSLAFSNLVLAEFLFLACPKLTKKEFDSHASDLSISYFISNGIYKKLK